MGKLMGKLEAGFYRTALYHIGQIVLLMLVVNNMFLWCIFDYLMSENVQYGSIRFWRKMAIKLNGVHVVGGSNPLAPTSKIKA
jgi:hypothetical protein